MKRWLPLLLFTWATLAVAQNNIILTNTPVQANANQTMIDTSFLLNFGAGQLYRDLVFASGGSMTGYYSAIKVNCSSGGTQTATNWFVNDIESSPYNFPANFWSGATYEVRNGGTGAVLGTGTITASTSNATAGMNLTMSPGLAAGCSSSDPDIMRIWLNTPTIPLTPSQYFYNMGTQVNSGATWDTTDLPAGLAANQEAISIPTTTTMTFNIDATYPNTVNTNPSLSSQQVNYIDVNGTYNYKFWYKCPSSTGNASIYYQISRSGGSTFVPSTQLTNACNATVGGGWVQINSTFTASETCSQTGVGTCPHGNVQFTFLCDSACYIADVHLIEGTALSPANTSVYRDSVVRTLRGAHPRALRLMDPSLWPASAAAMESTTPAFASVNSYTPYLKIYGTQNFHDYMGLCLTVGTDCYLSVSGFFTQTDWSNLPAWFASDSNYIALKNAGHTVLSAHNNEAFNNNAGGTLPDGDGVLYGEIAGADIHAFKASASYDSAHMKLVMNDQFASGQSSSSGNFGWSYESLFHACTVQNGCPDYSELAPYNGSYLADQASWWSSLAAEIANFDSVASVPSGYRGVLASTNYLSSKFPAVKMMVYEYNSGLISGSVAATQAQLNGDTNSVGEGLMMSYHYMLMQRDGGVVGPIGAFDLSGGENQYNGSSNPAVPIWHLMRMMPCGPGELSTCVETPTPQWIALSLVGNGIGSMSRMNVSQTGTPTYSYAGGQPQGGTNTIFANSTVNEVQAFEYGDGGTNFRLFLYNVDPAGVSHTVNLTGITPVGTITETTFPNAGNAMTDNNENTYLGAGSLAPMVTMPAPTSTSGTSITIPANSFVSLSFSNAGAPPSPSTGYPTRIIGVAY